MRVDDLTRNRQREAHAAAPLIERPIAVTVPEAERSEPVPPAFPSAFTDCPVVRLEESPTAMVFRCAAPRAWRTATSSAAS